MIKRPSQTFVRWQRDYGKFKIQLLCYFPVSVTECSPEKQPEGGTIYLAHYFRGFCPPGLGWTCLGGESKGQK